jgi:wobble nucleotide-excising tRNase
MKGTSFRVHSLNVEVSVWRLKHCFRAKLKQSWEKRYYQSARILASNWNDVERNQSTNPGINQGVLQFARNEELLREFKEKKRDGRKSSGRSEWKDWRLRCGQPVDETQQVEASSVLATEVLAGY